MNITDLIKVLAEEMAIDKFDKAVEGKVSPNVLATLAAKMKKGKYNNIALAILKGIQSPEADEEHKKYLEDHASQAYAVLRQMAKGNSSFNAASVVDEYLKSEKPETFWKEKYTENKEKGEKQETSNSDLGLSGARFKQTNGWYLIFPRTFYNDYFFSKKEDMNKGWLELKKISDEMANKDTTKSERAKVNHWCVAASSNTHFSRYKSSGGIFVVLVKKGKKGEPNWNNRYLWYCNRKGKSVQFANKFDTMKYPEEVLKDDGEALEILRKIRSTFAKKADEGKNRQINRDEVIKKYEWAAQKNLVHPASKKERSELGLYAKTNNYNKLTRLAKKAEANYVPALTFAFDNYFGKDDIVNKIKDMSNKSYKTRRSYTYTVYTCYPNLSLDFGIVMTVPNKEHLPIKFSLKRVHDFGESPITEVDRYTSNEEIREAIIKGFERTKPERKDDYKENIESMSKHYLTIKSKPDYSEMNNNKYSEALTKKMLDDKRKSFGDGDGIYTSVKFPFVFIIYVRDKGLFYYDKKNWMDTKICNLDDPDAMEKVKAKYREYMNEILPGFKVRF